MDVTSEKLVLDGASTSPGEELKVQPRLDLEPCVKAHDAEHHRFDDEDGACDDGIRG